MKVASAPHCWPEKLTTSQRPCPNCAHPLADLASASACEGIFQVVEKEPSAVNPIAPQVISEDGPGWFSGGWVGARGGAIYGAGEGMFGAGGGSGSGAPIEVCASTSAIRKMGAISNVVI